MPKEQLCPMMFTNPVYSYPRDCECEAERCAWWNEFLDQCGLIPLLLKKPKRQKKEPQPVSSAKIAESMAR